VNEAHLKLAHLASFFQAAAQFQILQRELISQLHGVSAQFLHFLVAAFAQ
jgi:hypothetical protein